MRMPWGENRNKYGDIIERGRMLDGKLNGEGVQWYRNRWIKSPHFYSGKVHGLFASYDENLDVIFYGVMIDDVTTECLEFHPFLRKEYEITMKEQKFLIETVDMLYT